MSESFTLCYCVCNCYCGDISTPLNMTRHKTCQSYGLLGGPWPFKAAKVPRPSAVSLKVWLRETTAYVSDIEPHNRFRGSSHKTHFSIPMQYFSIIFLCKHTLDEGLWPLRSHLLQHLAHEHSVFKMLCQVKRIYIFTCSVAHLTNQKTLEVGQMLWAFVYSSKLAWHMFYLMATWQRRDS